MKKKGSLVLISVFLVALVLLVSCDKIKSMMGGEQAVSQKKEDPNRLFVEALSALYSKNYDLAIQNAEKAKNTMPNNPIVPFILSQAQSMRGDTFDSLKSLDEALKNGFNKGDILFIVKADPEKLEVGDIIIFNANQRNPIIHRIVDIRDTKDGKVFSTIGDNNNGQLEFEDRITEEMLVGKAVARITPYFGWIKLVFYDWQKPPEERGFCDEN